MLSGHKVVCNCHFTIFIVATLSRHWGLTIFRFFFWSLTCPWGYIFRCRKLKNCCVSSSGDLSWKGWSCDFGQIHFQQKKTGVIASLCKLAFLLLVLGPHMGKYRNSDLSEIFSYEIFLLVKEWTGCNQMLCYFKLTNCEGRHYHNEVMLYRALEGGAPVKGCLCDAGASVEAGHLTALQLGWVACYKILICTCT